MEHLFKRAFVQKDICSKGHSFKRIFFQKGARLTCERGKQILNAIGDFARNDIS